MFKSVVHRLRSQCLVQYNSPKSNLSTKSAPKPVVASFSLAVKEAEKVVGYPTSFLNLRWLLNDEIANVATHIKKLVHVEHPLIEAAKGFLFKNDLPTWGLIVLLVAKCSGLNNEQNLLEIDHTAGILHSQRILADVAEMIRTSIMVHRGLLNPNDINASTNEKDLHFGNKLALLCGDYILSKCFNDLANIKNHDVNDLISSTLRDLTENEFLGQRDSQNFPLPTKPCQVQSIQSNLIADLDMGPYRIQEILGYCKPEWFLRNILGGANLLGKSCQAVCILTNQDEKLQESAFLLGKHMGLAWQMKIELEMFARMDFGKYFLVSAPVMWCLSSHPELYEDISKGLVNVDDCDFEQIHEFVSRTSAIDECKMAQRKLIDASFAVLEKFKDNPARKSLGDLLESLKV